MSKFFFDHPQLPLLSDAEVSTELPIVKKYENLFDLLDLSHIRDHNDGEGCSGYSRRSIIKALIVKEQEKCESIPDLIWLLKNQPYLTNYVIGFKSSIPNPSVFYRFLKAFPTSKIRDFSFQGFGTVSSSFEPSELPGVSAIAFSFACHSAAFISRLCF